MLTDEHLGSLIVALQRQLEDSHTEIRQEASEKEQCLHKIRYSITEGTGSS